MNFKTGVLTLLKILKCKNRHKGVWMTKAPKSYINPCCVMLSAIQERLRLSPTVYRSLSPQEKSEKGLL